MILGERSFRLRRGLLLVAAWAFVAAFFIAQGVASSVIRGEPVEWFQAVTFETLYWVPWVIFTPLLLRVFRRYRLEAGTWRRTLPVHLGTAAVFSLVQSTMFYAMVVWALRASGDALGVTMLGGDFWRRVLVGSLTTYWKYWFFVGAYYAIDYYRKYRDRELEASRLEARLARARLSALKAQLHPHFLFNTLHSISMLNLTDVDAANRVVVKLGELLRITLETSGEQRVPIERELALVDRYLEIEAVRLGDRLRVEWEVEEEVLGALVPNLVLQPLVENAIRHGIAPRSGPGRLAIRARRAEEELVLEVEDDGPGLPDGWDLDRDAGVGLANTVDRLERMYGEGHRLRFVEPGTGGFLVRVAIPFEAADEGRAGEPDETSAVAGRRS